MDCTAVINRYQQELCALLEAGQLDNGNTKMIAICRTSTMKVPSGKDAMSLLLTSERVYSDMLDLIKYGEPEQICLRQWMNELTLEYEFRVFVYNHNITAISQYDHYTYFPTLDSLKPIIQQGIYEIWTRMHAMVGSSSYVVDIGYIPTKPDGSKFVVIEFSPFLPCTGAALLLILI